MVVPRARTARDRRDPRAEHATRFRRAATDHRLTVTLLRRGPEEVRDVGWFWARPSARERAAGKDDGARRATLPFGRALHAGAGLARARRHRAVAHARQRAALVHRERRDALSSRQRYVRRTRRARRRGPGDPLACAAPRGGTRTYLRS